MGISVSPGTASGPAGSQHSSARAPATRRATSDAATSRTCSQLSNTSRCVRATKRPDEQRGGPDHPVRRTSTNPSASTAALGTLVALARPRPARPRTPGHGTTSGTPRRLDGEAGLARPTGANQADHAMIGDESAKLRELAVAANEAGEWSGSAGRAHGSRPRTGNLCRRMRIARRAGRPDRGRPAGPAPGRAEVFVRRAVIVLDARQQLLPGGSRPGAGSLT